MKKFLFICISIILASSINLQAQVLLGGKKLINEFSASEKISTSKTNLFIIEVQNPFTNAQHKIALDNQIKVLEYIPKNNYLIEINPNSNTSVLNNLGLISWDYLKTEHKLSRMVNSLEFPVYALLGNNKVKLDVFPYHQKDFQTLKVDLVSNGFEVLSEALSKNGYTVIAEIDDIKKLSEINNVFFIDVVSAPSLPENLVGKTDHRSNFIASKHPELRQYNGEGVNVAMGDDRLIGPHIDYQGRIDQSSTSGNNGDHGDHVAGTIMGAGNLDPSTEGMASGAFLYVYTVWDAVNDAPTDYNTRDVRITSTSYSNGCNAGYTNFARTADLAIYNAPGLNHVFSAGNNGTSACTGIADYGAGPTWGNVTGGVKVGKNVIAVANLTAADVIAPSSSRGPAADGRIKPDVSAVGTDVYSTVDVNSYAFKTGTSMSCPGTSGSLAQLYHAFKDIQGYEPDGGLMKAILMNSCDDLGNAGPDFIHGYGRLNLRRAVDMIEKSNFLVDTVSQGTSKNFTLNVPNGTQFIDVMVYWTDNPAVSNANRALVNNLDMTVTDPNNVVYNPWVLDPTPNPVNLNTPAVRAVDSLNNAEQVTIDQPTPGNITVTVNGSAVPFGPQKFYVVYQFRDESITLTYPNGGEGIEPSSSETIRWDALEGTSTFSLEYSTDSGATWTSIATGINADSRFYNWSVPQVLSDNVQIKVVRGSQSDVSDKAFNIVSVPNNFKLDYICPDSMKVSWGAVPGVNGYLVTMLGNKYMDSVAFSNTNFAVIKGLNPSLEKWMSIQAMFPSGAKGKRDIAINIPAGTRNCIVDVDAQVKAITFPRISRLAACLDDQNSNISVEIKNNGVQSITNLPLNYKINNNAVVTETYSGTLNSGDSIIYTFSQAEDFTALSGNNNLIVWNSLSTDANSFNDSIIQNLEVYTGQTNQVAFQEDFESFNLCLNTTNCGGTTCDLSNGWINLTNGSEDGIDWRTFSGPTASNGTGPSADHKPGNSSGKYLYLEASGTCLFEEAKLLSPCLDIPANQSTELSFWLNMNGANIGEFHLDVMVNGDYLEDFIIPLAGNKGTNWFEQKVNLSAFAGKTIVLVFRGITGNDFAGDIALDDISIYQVNTPPTADFNASDIEICPGGTIKLFDGSVNAPSSWNWSISPSTIQFINGTNQNSQNPEILLLNSGYYDVELVVSNQNGTDTIFKNSYLFSDAGAFPPVAQDFNSTSLPPAGWLIENPTGNFTWQFRFGVIGKDGTSNTAVFVNNFNALDGGGEDGLVLEQLDLTNSINSFLTFDVGYVTRPGGFEDGLRVDISSDCGNSFVPSGYLKMGSNLATAAPSSSLWIPTSASDWRTDTVDLTPYLGGSIIIKIVNINGNGNGLHLDNINIFDFSPPKADFIYGNELCELKPVMFFDNSFGYQKNLTWDFGSSANPATANGVGPHSIIFSNQGPHNINLTVQNPLGTDSISKTVSLASGPSSGFGNGSDSTGMSFAFWSTASNYNNISWFVNDSLINGADSAFVTFNKPIEYAVMQVVENVCGSDTTIQIVKAINIGVDELDDFDKISFYPNPVKNDFTLINSSNKQLILSLRDITSKVIEERVSNEQLINWNIKSLPSGVYFLMVSSTEGNKVLKITKTN